MDLQTVKSYDNTWWLKHLELTTVYDTKLIKEQFEWLIKRAEKADRYEDLALDHHYQTILDEMD